MMENAFLKGEDLEVYRKLCQLHIEVSHLSGLEKTLKRTIPPADRRWNVDETPDIYEASCPSGLNPTFELSLSPPA